MYFLCISMVFWLSGTIEADMITKIIARACERDPSMSYCRKSPITEANSALPEESRTADTLHMARADGGPALRDPAPEKDVFRSANRESSKILGNDYCDENEPRYRHYCQGVIERSSRLQKELFDYCIGYERRCRDKLEEARLNQADRKIEQEDSSRVESTDGLTEEATAEQVEAYCERFMPNFLYFCVGDDSDSSRDKNRIKRFCYAFSQNCPENLKKIAQNFPEKSIKSFGKSVPSSSSKSQSGSDSDEERDEAEVRDYCNQYEKNFKHFCGSKQRTMTNDDDKKIKDFCQAYSSICNRQKTTEKSGRPPDPFQSFVSKTNDKRPSEVFDAFKNPEALTKTSKSDILKVPCTPDCDQRIHAHCTAECKCDFLYPAVQEFCNPPPMPIFLQTCRMWYASCPKYKQYHYASQFIRSKAEKGKVDPGQTIPAGSIPETILRSRDFPPTYTDFVRRNPNEQRRPIREPRPDPVGINLGYDHIVPPWNRAPIQLPNIPLPRLQQRSPRAYQSSTADGNIHAFDKFTDSGGRVKNQLQSRSPFTKPGLWEANPSNPHNRDHANKFLYLPDSVNVDWLQGQYAAGGHWAVPAVNVGGTNGFGTVHFPSIGVFAGIDDDYD